MCAGAAPLLDGFKALESQLQERCSVPTGRIRLVSTFGFVRLWLGPALARFQERHPQVQIKLQLTEQLPDSADDDFDGAVWLWSISGSKAAQGVSRHLGRNQRVLVAAPSYIRQHGAPHDVASLQQHACLVVRENSNASGQPFDAWQLSRQSVREKTRPASPPSLPKRKGANANGMASNEVVRNSGPLSSNSGELVRDWCLDGRGIMLRSLWDISPQLASGNLVRVLPGWCMPDADIHWLAPYRPDSPHRIRLLIDFLAAEFATEPCKLDRVPAKLAVTASVVAKPAVSRLRSAPPGSRQQP